MMLTTARDIAKWCEETPERRKAVMAKLEALQLFTGAEPGTLLEEAQRQVYDMRDRPPRPSESFAPGALRTWLLITDRKDLRRVARDETTLGAITVGRIEASNSLAARRHFNAKGDQVVISEENAREVIADYVLLRKSAERRTTT